MHLPLPQGQGKYDHMSQEWEVVQKQQGKSSPVENALGSLFLTWMERDGVSGFLASQFYPKY